MMNFIYIFINIYEPAHDTLVLIALSSNEGSGYAPPIHKEEMSMKTQTKTKTFSPVG